jgi:hypothetical protein
VTNATVFLPVFIARRDRTGRKKGGRDFVSAKKKVAKLSRTPDSSPVSNFLTHSAEREERRRGQLLLPISSNLQKILSQLLIAKCIKE